MKNRNNNFIRINDVMHDTQKTNSSFPSLPPHVSGCQIGKLKFELSSLNLFQSTNKYFYDGSYNKSRNTSEEKSESDRCSQELLCRIQFWGESSFVDLSLNHESMNFSSPSYDSRMDDHSDNIHATKILHNLVEYDLLGSIVGLKHYFKDMNMLTLLILRGRGGRNKDSLLDAADEDKEGKESYTKDMEVIGHGNLNLVSILNELMKSLKPQQIKISSSGSIDNDDWKRNESNKYVTVTSTYTCKEPIKAGRESCSSGQVLGSLEMKIQIEVYYHSQSTQSKKKIDAKSDLEGSMNTSIVNREVKLNKEKSCRTIEANKTVLKQNAMMTQSYFRQGRTNHKTNSLVFNEFGLDETSVSSFRTSTDDYDSIIYKVMLPRNDSSGKRQQKLFPRVKLSHEDSSFHCFYSDDDGGIGNDLYDSESCDELIAELLRNENHSEKSVNACKYVGNQSISPTVGSMVMSMKFVDISMYSINFSPSSSDVLRKLQMKHRLNRFVVYVHYTITPSLLSSTCSSNQVTVKVCSCICPKVHVGQMNRTSNSSRRQRNQKVHKIRLGESRKFGAGIAEHQNVHKPINLPKNHVLLHRNKFPISISRNHTTNTRCEIGIKFDMIVEPEPVSVGAQSLPMPLNRKDHAVASGFISFNELFQASDFSFHDNLPLYIIKGSTNAEKKIFAYMKMSIKLLTDNAGKTSISIKQNKETRMPRSVSDLESIPGTKLEQSKGLQIAKLSSTPITVWPIWMNVEIKNFLIKGVIMDASDSSIQLRIKVSCSLAIASLEDLKYPKSLKSVKHAIKEAVLPVYFNVVNGEKIASCKAAVFHWNTPLKIDTNYVYHPRFDKNINQEVVIESWIQYCDNEGFQQDQFIGVSKIPFLIMNDTTKISFNSTSQLRSFTKRIVKLKGGLDTKICTNASVTVAVGWMKSIMHLPKVRLAVKTIEKWWVPIRDSLSHFPEVENVAQVKRIMNEPMLTSNEEERNNVMLHQNKSHSVVSKVMLIQTFWRKRATKRYQSQNRDSIKNRVIQGADQLVQLAVDEITNTLKRDTYIASNTYNDEKCRSMKEIMKQSKAVSIDTSIFKQKTKLNESNTKEKQKSKPNESNTKESSITVFMKVGSVSGIHEILTLWLDNGNLPEISLNNQHELIASGVIILFQLPSNKTESKHPTSFRSTKILSLNELKRQSIDFQTSFEIDQSDEIIAHVARERLQCDLWFIPLVTDSMQKKHQFAYGEVLHLPMGSTKVCSASLPMKAIVFVSTPVTYKCSWTVPLTSDSKDIEMMGHIHISLSRDSANFHSEAVINLCHNNEFMVYHDECDLANELWTEPAKNHVSNKRNQLGSFAYNSIMNYPVVENNMGKQLKSFVYTLGNNMGSDPQLCEFNLQNKFQTQYGDNNMNFTYHTNYNEPKTETTAINKVEGSEISHRCTSEMQDQINSVNTSNNKLENDSYYDAPKYDCEVFSARNLSSVLESLEFITADITNTLKKNINNRNNNSQYTKQSAVLKEKTKGTYPRNVDPIITDLPQIQSKNAWNNKKKVMNEDFVEGTSKQRSLSVVMELLNDVSIDLHTTCGIQNLKKDNQDNGYEDCKEEKEDAYHDNTEKNSCENTSNDTNSNKDRKRLQNSDNGFDEQHYLSESSESSLVITNNNNSMISNSCSSTSYSDAGISNFVTNKSNDKHHMRRKDQVVFTIHANNFKRNIDRNTDDDDSSIESSFSLIDNIITQQPMTAKSYSSSSSCSDSSTSSSMPSGGRQRPTMMSMNAELISKVMGFKKNKGEQGVKKL